MKFIKEPMRMLQSLDSSACNMVVNTAIVDSFICMDDIIAMYENPDDKGETIVTMSNKSIFYVEKKLEDIYCDIMDSFSEKL